MRSSIRRSGYAAFCAGLLLLTSSCNIFAFMDSPGDNEEYLSKARACFDEGDITCAREYYNKLTGSYSDIKHSEIAYTILYEFGIDMGAFMESFGDGGGGSGLTVLANRILRKIGTPTVATRVELYEAYKKVALIEDTELAGLVKFLSALAFAAHILAENASDSEFTATDIVTNPAGCLAAGAGCNASPDCATTSALNNGDNGDIDDPDGATSNGIDDAPGLDLFNTAINAMDQGLDAVGAGGKFSSSKGLAESLLAAGVDECYRQGMLDEGIGFNPGE